MKMNWYKKIIANDAVTFCKSCDEVAPLYHCHICKAPIRGHCRECHNELAHDQVDLSGNIPFFSGEGFQHLAPRQRAKKK
jgi:hypothetical protein